MKETHIPLISKPIWDMSPKEFKDLVDGMYVDPKAGRVAPAAVNISLNKKGNPVVRISRKPKWITNKEIDEAASKLSLDRVLVLGWITKRKIEINDAKIAVDISGGKT